MTICKNTALLDANILVYAADKNSPYYEKAALIREKGMRGEISICVCPQVLVEFFAIITDKKRVANPITQKEAVKEIEKYLLEENIFKIYQLPTATEIIIKLLRQYRINRQKIFDLQLAATMLANGVNEIYTFNKKDFERFSKIKVLTP
ncbi:MAG: type II toxin-antitoxin system VapC family toxin [bacterium]